MTTQDPSTTTHPHQCVHTYPLNSQSTHTHISHWLKRSLSPPGMQDEFEAPSRFATTEAAWRLAIQKTVNLNLKRQVGSVDRSCVNDLPSRNQIHVYTQSPCPTTNTPQHKFPQLTFPITNTHHSIPRLLPYNHNNQITRLFPTINKKTLFTPSPSPPQQKLNQKPIPPIFFFSHARSQIQQHIFETQIYQLLFTNSRFTTTTSPW